MCQYYLAKLQVYIDSYTSCNAHARMKSTHKKELRTYRLLLNNTPDWLQKRVIASNVNGKDFFISVFERSLSWKRNIIRFEWNFQFLFLVFSRTISGHVFFFTPTKERLQKNPNENRVFRCLWRHRRPLVAEINMAEYGDGRSTSSRDALLSRCHLSTNASLYLQHEPYSDYGDATIFARFCFTLAYLMLS